MCIEILGPHNCHGPQGGPLLFIAISFSPLTDKWASEVHQAFKSHKVTVDKASIVSGLQNPSGAI